MRILGWIREGDLTACGGRVIEGDQRVKGRGRAYAFEGARIACEKGCVIAQGYARARLTNGRQRVIHGMLSTNGCPCYSTLNNVDGAGDVDGSSVSEHYVRDALGHWIGSDQGPAPQQFDEQFKLQASGVDGVPYYIVLVDGRSQSGRLAADGLMPRIATLQSENYMVYWGDAALVMLAGEGQ